MRPSRSIRNRLTGSFLVLAVAPLLVTCLVLFWQTFSYQRGQALQLQQQLALGAASETASFVASVDIQLRAVARQLTAQDFDSNFDSRRFARIIHQYPALEEMSLMDASGTEIARASRTKVFTEWDLRHRQHLPEFQVPFNRKLRYSGPVRFDPETSEPFMALSVPVEDPRTGAVRGVLAGQIRLKGVWDLVAALKVGENGTAFIVDQYGRVVAHPNPSIVLRGTRFDSPETNGMNTGLAGNTVLIASQAIPLDDQTLYVVAERPLLEAMAPTIRSGVIMLGIITLSVMAAAALAALAVRQIVRPVESLAATARAISSGDLTQRASVGTRDELGALASAFNAMTDRLQATINALKDRVSERDQAVKKLDKEIAERKLIEEELRDSNLRLNDTLGQLKTTQDQLVQQERLRALGEMASGIAHDFNNALAPVVGFSELLVTRPQDLDDKEKVLNYLQIINIAAKDASKVVSRLREFYRHREEGELFLPVDLNALVDQSIALTQPKWKDQALGNGVVIEVLAHPEPVPTIAGNASELREVLTNLIFNAVDAVAEKAKGRPKGAQKKTDGSITLRTYTRYASDQSPAAGPQGEQAVLEITDTGIGMTKDVLQRCLEPFFTTKGVKGTGLGLSMVFGIVKRHRGRLDIQSAWGQGTTITITLPIGSTADLSASAPAPEKTPQCRPLHVLERVVKITYSRLLPLGSDRKLGKRQTLWHNGSLCPATV